MVFIRQLILLAFVLIYLFLPQPVHAQPPTAILTGPDAGVVNQAVLFKTTARGKQLARVTIYAAKFNADLEQQQSWVTIADALCSGDSCNAEGVFIPQEAILYYVVVNVRSNDSVCSGNPILLQKSLPGWLDCGIGSRLIFTSSALAPGSPSPAPSEDPILSIGPPDIGTPVPLGSISPSVSPNPQDNPEYTMYYKIAEQQKSLAKAPLQYYTQNPLKVAYTFKDKTPGERYLWVRFITNKNNYKDVSIKIRIPTKGNPDAAAPVTNVQVSDYDTYILGNKITRTFINTEGRYAYYQTLDIADNQVRFTSQAPWKSLDLDNLRGVGNERYSGYGTFILGNQFYQTFIDLEGRYAYSRILSIEGNEVLTTSNSAWMQMDLNNLRGQGNERYSGYSAYMIDHTYYQVFLDKGGRFAYFRRVSIANNKIQNDYTPWERIDLDNARQTSTGERYQGYNVYTINNHFVQTLISQDGTTAYTRVFKLTGDEKNSHIQGGSNVAWLSQPISNPALGENPTTLVYTGDYFNFKPGDYWIFEGRHLNGIPYRVRFDVENLADAALVYQGKNMLISSYPLRVTNDINAPGSQSGGVMDYTWFLSKDFNYNNQQIKWALKTVFYKRSPVPILKKEPIKTAAFFSMHNDYPAYYTTRLNQDLTLREIRPYNGAMINNPNFYDGDIGPYMVTGDEGGWDTAYNMVYVNFPKYQGEAFRIRFWEYGTENQGLAHTNSYNYDEWFFAKNIGIVGINNKIRRGIPGDGRECYQDADCDDRTNVMQKPSFSVGLVDYVHFEDGENVNVAIEGDKLKVTTQKGNNYTGFLEIQGINIPRAILKTAAGMPIWIENGVGLISNLNAEAKGKQVVQFRPYIYNEKGVELGPNRLNWSNEVEIEAK